MTATDYIVIGQGIAGTMISWFLEKRGLSYIVVDNHHHNSSSMVAAGLINPITGRRFVRSWRINEFLPFAKKTYREMSQKIHQKKIFVQNDIFRALYTIGDENTWHSLYADPESAHYIKPGPQNHPYYDYFNGALSYGIIQNGGRVRFQSMLKEWRSYLSKNKKILEEKMDYARIVHSPSKVTYKDIVAKKIIFAEGYQVRDNPWFGHLDHSPTKGEVILIKLSDIQIKDIIRNKIFLVPYQKDIYWVGSAYDRDDINPRPTPKGKKYLEDTLQNIFNGRYEIIDHRAAIRPTVKKRRPMMGKHHRYPNLVLFNGLGTKGASLAPYWAHHLVSHLEDDTPLDDEVKIPYQ